MALHSLPFPDDAITAFCTRHGVRLLAVFGSALRDDFNEASDIDVLVEFLPERGPSLLGFAAMQMELSGLAGREVHLHTPAMLPPKWRESVRQEARVQYAA